MADNDPNSGIPLKTPVEAEAQPIQEGKKLTQYIAALAATLGAFCAGTILSWTSPALTILENANTTVLEQPIEKEEGMWIGSLLAVGALIGAFPAGACAEKFGRRLTIMGLALPFTISWLLIIFANSVGMLYAARIFAGIATGGISAAAPMYIGEIAESSVRGALGSYFQLLLTIGILFSYLFGAIVSFKWLGILSGIVPIIFLVVFFFMPETPSFLLKSGKKKEAEKALQWLRGEEYDIKDEMSVIQADIDDSLNNKATLKDLVSSKATLNALIVSLGLMVFQQLSGINAVIFYTAGIFEAAGSSLDSDVCSIIVGVVQVITTLIATLLVDRAGRRILLLLSSTVMCVCLIVLGVYFHMQEKDKSSVADIGWLPLMSVTLFIIVFSLGFGPLPWMMMAELFPTNVKGIASGLAVTLNWTLTFVVTRTFQSLINAIHTSGTFWLFGGITAAGVLFVFFKVPETKGKSFVEIQKMLGGD